MPKKRGKPSRVSSDTIAAIKNLHSMIETAEHHLKKMPGSREPDCKTSVNEVMWHPDYHHDSDSFDLVFHEDMIQVRQSSFDPLDGSESNHFTKLDQLDTTTRIQLARHVPDLIMAAKNSEQKVRQAADDAAAMIEMAIAKSMEVENES